MTGQFSNKLIALYRPDPVTGKSGAAGDPHAIANTAEAVITENYEEPSAAIEWLLTAQLLQSVNWSREAVFALRQAEAADPRIVNNAGTLRLAAVAGYLSGDSAVFRHFAFDPQHSPLATADTSFLNDHPNPLTAASSRAASMQLAHLLSQDPSVADLGHALQGDLAAAAGNYPMAVAEYSSGLHIKASPSLLLRLAGSQVSAFRGGDAIETLKLNKRQFPGPLSKLSTEVYQEVAIKEEQENKPIS